MSLMDAMNEIRAMRAGQAALPDTLVVAYTTEEGGKWWLVNTENIRNCFHCKLNADSLCEQTFRDWFNVPNVAAVKLANGDIYDFILDSWRHLYGMEKRAANLTLDTAVIRQHRQDAEASMMKAQAQTASALDTQEGGSHYKSLAIQPIEYITKNKIPYPEGNVIKYVTRHSSKNGIEDIKKAFHYLQLIAELQYGTKL